MKIKKAFKRNPLAQWIACALAVASVSGIAYAAAPLAGTEIKNLATVSYEDENGNQYTAQSNEAVITVAPQYKATIENDRTQSAAPGQTVYFPHTIVNTGNIADTYTLSIADDANAAVAGTKIFIDTNGNGQPDSGESEITSLNLAAGETANVIVSYPVPIAAADGSSTRMHLSVVSDNGGVVDDLATNNGADTTEGTSSDVVNVTTGPVLVLNKEAVFDAANSKVTYTLTVKNTGGSEAKLVDIIDAVPMVDHDDDAGTARLPLMNPTIVSVNGLLTSNGDTVPAVGAAVPTTADETVLGVDLDGDGLATNTVVDVVKATDAVLAPNTTVSLVYSATYDPTWRAGQDIDNTFVTYADNDDDGTPETTTTSNTTTNSIPQTYTVDANDDNGVNAIDANNANNGHDDDVTPSNDTQLVDSIAAGDTVVFAHTITNNGNGDDIVNLMVTNTDFPAGTVFTLWNADGTVQLTDSDSDGIPDTGVLGQNESRLVVVKADLPADGTSGTNGGNGYNAVLTGTSSGDDTQFNPTTLKLDNITAPAVDLAAVSVNEDTGVVVSNNATQPEDGFDDNGVENAHNEGPVILKDNAVVGSTVMFPMALANESGSSDSFLLDHEDLPTGWTVVFKDEDGNTITATPFLPAGDVFNYTAEVTISSDPAQALADTALDATRLNDANGVDNTNTNADNAPSALGNDLVSTDTDNDYVIKFTVKSSVDSTRMDSILHAVDVVNTPAISITPDGQNQVQPGGTVEYLHKLANNGNVAESVELVANNADPDWGSTTLIEKVVGGVVELVEITTLVANDTVRVYNPDGTTTDVVVTDVDGDAATTGSVEFPLTPGQYLNITNKVFAPADAPQGEVNATTFTAQDPDGTSRNVATDTSNVILGQVRLDKSVALQTDCADTGTIGAFASIQANKVEPGQCAVWKIIAKNEGDATVNNVVVSDNVPTYTSFRSGSLMYCKGLSCTLAPVSDSTANDEGEVVNGLVTFYVGDSSDPVTQKGGSLLSGESATMHFTVEIDQ